MRSSKDKCISPPCFCIAILDVGADGLVMQHLQMADHHVLYDLQDLLKLSDKQIQDLMFIRRVWYVKHHLLSSQRKAVAANILEASPTPVVNVTKIAASAVQLEQQAEDEHDVILRVKWAIHCGVWCQSSSKKLPRVML